VLSIEYLEHEIGLSANEMVKGLRSADSARMRQAIAAKLDRDSAKAIHEKISSYGRDHEDNSYLISELSPGVFDSDFNYAAGHSGVGAPPPRGGASIEHIRHTLLYAHHIYMSDPLESCLWNFYEPYGDFHFLVLLQALSEWEFIRPLVKNGFIKLRYGWSGEGQAVREFVDEAFDDPVFLAQLMDLGAWRSRPEHRVSAAMYRAARDRDDVREMLQFAWWEDSFCAPSWDDDLVRAIRSAQQPGADLWLPSKRHAKILQALAGREAGRTGPRVGNVELFSTLVEMEVPSIANLDARTLVAIRIDSEVFEEWRIELKSALSYLSDHDSDDSAKEAVQSAMGAVAERMQVKLRRERTSILAGGLRAFATGFAAFGATGVLAGTDSWLPTLAGSILTGAADSAWQTVEGTNRRRSIKAAGQHALILSELQV
jgi:hypothetical protein